MEDNFEEVPQDQGNAGPDVDPLRQEDQEEREVFFMPAEPTMGQLLQVRDDEYVAVTGGAPNYEWTELETAPETIEPTMFRTTHPTSAAKSRAYRTKPLNPKIRTNSDMIIILREIWEHLKLLKH